MIVDYLFFWGWWIILFILTIIIITLGFILASKLLKIKKNYKTAFYVSLYFIGINFFLSGLDNLFNNFIFTILLFITNIIILVSIIKRNYKVNYQKSILIFICVAIFSAFVIFLIVNHVMFPILSLYSGATSPIVLVVSRSMEHNGLNFEDWWEQNKEWYVNNDITKNEFETFILKNGINKRDMMMLKDEKNINIGNIIVFKGNSTNLMINRVVDKWVEDEKVYYKVKGDDNSDSFIVLGENRISEEDVAGKVTAKIPYVGLFKSLDY